VLPVDARTGHLVERRAPLREPLSRPGECLIADKPFEVRSKDPAPGKIIIRCQLSS
jgi:hypothetical protein